MDVRLSPEQRQLRDTAASVADRLGPRAVGELDDRQRSGRLEAAVAEAGWLELRTPGDGGRPLASGVEVALVAEELARGLADVAFTGPTLAAELRRLAGAAPAPGPETVALDTGLSSPARVVDGLAPQMVAVDAAGAAAALVLVPASAGHLLAEVGLGPLGPSLDLTRPSAAGDASGGLLRAVGGARALSHEDLLAWTALGLAVSAADLVGVMRGAVTLARDYAAERRQFGQPVGAFQAVQHLLADAFVATEGARSAALHAAWAVDTCPASEALAAAAAAKAYCARAARAVCETAVQVHGGIGNTWECLAHVYLRRALLSVDLLGGVEANLERVLVHEGIGGDRGLR